MDDGATIGLVAALIGVSGGVIAAMTAAFITYLATVRAARATYNLASIEREREFVGEMTEAAEAQYLLLGNILRGVEVAIAKAQAAVNRGETPEVHHQHDKKLADQLAAATAGWRKVLARRALCGQGHLSNALTTFDRVRADLVDAINETDIPRARQILDGMEAGALHLLQLAVAVTAAHANVLIASSVLAGPERRRAMKAHQANATDVQGTFEHVRAEITSRAVGTTSS